MSADNKQHAALVYIGSPGSGLGMQLAGMTVIDCTTPDELLSHLKRLKKETAASIIFVDEGLASDVLDEVEQLNDDPMPAIVLLAHPTQPRRLAAQRMQDLMVRAVGSDVTSL